MVSNAVMVFPPIKYSSIYKSFFEKTNGGTDTVSQNEIKQLSLISDSLSPSSTYSSLPSSALPTPTVSSKTFSFRPSCKIKWKKIKRTTFNRSKSYDNPTIVTSSKKKTNQSSNTMKCETSCISGEIANVDSTQLTLLQLFALKSLNLTAPASDLILKVPCPNKWIQLSGHRDSFSPAAPGTIWKKRTNDDREVKAYQLLMKEDKLSSMVPKFYGDISFNNENFIELQDLLYGFDNPSIMDIKMGTRTFLESEVNNQNGRNDLYLKMVKIDENAATEEERIDQKITKLRYMTFREDLSSSSTLGFRIEGFRMKGETPSTNLKLTKSPNEVKECLNEFINNSTELRDQLIKKLNLLKISLIESKFFSKHEIIGSSLLIIYDDKRIGVWMIDFAKTILLSDDIEIDHISKWVLGNHEDGYLFGLTNLINLLQEIKDTAINEVKVA